MSMTETFRLKKYKTTIYEHTCDDCGDVIALVLSSRKGHKKDGKKLCSYCYSGRKKTNDPGDYEGTPV